MSYRLGIDLGTTHTAAAVYRDGQVTLVRLGVRTAETPTVLFLLEDGAWRVGDAAERRGAVDPTRLARQFKRRLGDPVPLLLGGSPFSAQALMAEVLRQVVRLVHEQEGGAPEALMVTHPAAWGPYRQETFDQALRLADVGPTTKRSEPEAAVLQYAADHPLDEGQVVVVYDLGGGTFDTAVVRRTAGGLQLAGAPEGIEHLGGADFDEAVFRHVVEALGSANGDLDLQDPAVLADVARLRADCREAKESLSHDTEVIVHAALPGTHAQVRLSREQLETMLRPALTQTMDAVRRALRVAHIDPEDVTAVVLAGGSSRIPLVRELLDEAFGRPVVSDGHPEHLIALGAARPALGSPSQTQPAAAITSPTASPAVVPRSDPSSAPRRVAEPETSTDRSADPRSLSLPVVSPAERRAPASAPLREPAPGPGDEPAVAPPGQGSLRRRLAGRRNQALAAGLALLLAVFGAVLGVRALVAEPTVPPEWTQLDPLPVASDSPGVASFRGEVWVVGGLGPDEGRPSLDSVLIFDPDESTWREGPRLPIPIDHAALVSTGDRLVLLGGKRETTPGESGVRTSLSTVYELVDPAGPWQRGVDLPAPRGALAAAWDGQRIVVGGGVDLAGIPRDDVWTLSGGVWERIGNLQTPREHLTATSDGDGSTWFLGGGLLAEDARASGLTDVVEGNVVEPGPAIEPVGAAAAVWTPDTGPCLLGGRRPDDASTTVECLYAEESSPWPDLPIPVGGSGATILGDRLFLAGGFTDTLGGSTVVFDLRPL